jgi:hypothetical protein
VGTTFRLLVSKVVAGLIFFTAREALDVHAFFLRASVMKALDPDNTSEAMQPPLLLAGLLAGAITAFAMSRLPASRFMSWSDLIASASGRVFAVFFAATLSNVGLYRTKGACGASRWHLALRMALAAIWLAPLALFIRQDSWWALLITAILVSRMGASFRLLRDASDNEIPSLACGIATSSFSLLESPDWCTQFYAVGGALCAEAGALATFSGHLLSGTLLVAISSAAWVHALRHLSPRTSDESFRSRSRAPFVFALAIMFTAAGLMPRLGGGHEFGGSSGKQRISAASEGVRHDKGARQRFAGSTTQDAYAGIVLWPKQVPTKLVAPVPILGNRLSAQRGTPLVIPFAGVYWFFKAPDVRLPKKPREAQGSPEVFSIHSTDRQALSMEAHQNLGTLIDLSCCSEIQIAIRNADRYPGTVSLELIVMNTTLRGRPSQSLGRTTVRSMRPWMLDDDRPPTTEVLHFTVPANSRISRFDEVMVVFHLDSERSFAAAKMGIERFVLVPHGI